MSIFFFLASVSDGRVVLMDRVERRGEGESEGEKRRESQKRGRGGGVS